nr:WXG100 family type VII secretion target [Micromonospora sp. DSM 115978]
MSAVAERTRTYLEDFVAKTPVEVRHVAQQIATALQDLMETVAGDPDELWAAAEQIRAEAKKLADLGQAQSADRAAATGGGWCGGSADAFDALMADNDERVRQLVANLDQVAEVLTAAHRAAADAINLLLELIFSLTAMFLAEAVAAAAAGLFSLGTSLLVFVARWLVKLTKAVSRGWTIIRTLGAALGKCSSRLREIAAWLARYRQTLREIKEAMRGKNLTWSEYFALKGKHALLVGVPIAGVNMLSPVNIPGKVGAFTDGVIGAWDLTSDGRKDRNYVLDGTYQDDLGPNGRWFQDLIDALN